MKTLCLLLFTASLLISAAAAQTTGSATLGWGGVTDTNSIAPITYKFYQGTASGAYSPAQSVGTSLTYTTTNLVRGTTYYFAVTAVGTYRAGTNTYTLESTYSNEVNYRPATPPAPPTVLTIISGS